MQHTDTDSAFQPPAFAHVHQDVIRDRNLKDGPAVAFALCCALSAISPSSLATWGDGTPVDYVHPTFKTPAGGWHKTLPCSRNQAYRWIGELRDAGLVRSAWMQTPMAFHFIKNPDLIRNREDNYQGFSRIDLTRIFAMRPGAARLFMVLTTYADRKTGECFPSIRTLAAACGATERTVQYRLGWLAKHGHVTVTQRYKRSSVYRVPLAPTGPDKRS